MRLRQRRPSIRLRGRFAGAVVCAGLFAGAGTALAVPTTATATTPVPATTAASPPAGTMTPVAEIPNVFYDPKNPNFNSRARLVADPANNLLFETLPGVSCSSASPNLAVFDSDTYRLLAEACVDSPLQEYGSDPAPFLAIDSTDRLILVPTNGSPNATTPGVLYALDERTLAVVATLNLPVVTDIGPSSAQAFVGSAESWSEYPALAGIYWDESADTLILTHDDTNLEGGEPTNSGKPVYLPGVVVSAYQVRAALAAGGQPLTPSWETTVSACSADLNNTLGPAGAFTLPGLAYLYLPCSLNTPVLSGPSAIISLGSPPTATGVVRLGMGPSGCAAGVSSCPDGTSATAVAPGAITDFFPSPGSAGGYGVTQQSPVKNSVSNPTGQGIDFTTGTDTALLYDGVTNAFVGRVGVATTVPGHTGPLNDTAFTVNLSTGRFYATSPQAMVVVDGADVPPSTEGEFTQYGCVPDDGSDYPALPPDAAHPYVQVVVGCERYDSSDGLTNLLPYFTVFADTIPATSNPPASSVDANTYAGTVPAGNAVTSVYGANSDGTGAHEDWVGSYGGYVNNVVGTSPPLPLAGANRDVLAGWVQGASLQNGSGQAAATALGDGNGTTAAGTSACTNASALDGCQSQAPNLAGAPQTSEQWPAGEAACPLPTSSGLSEKGQSPGLSVTTGYGSDGTPSETSVPGVAATASVDCAANSPAPGSVVASADLASLDSSATAGPLVAVASASSWAIDTPGGSGTPPQSSFTSTARGVSIDMGGSSLHIGEITQTVTATAGGRPGTAQATRMITLSDVNVTSAGTTNVICAAVCSGDPQQVVAQLDSALPAIFQVSMPEPWSPFAKTITSATGVETIPGSPGGYEAVVEQPPGSQQYDALFNGYLASTGETAMLPALRVAVFADGVQQLDRVIVDLAPAEADAEQGVTVSCPPGSYAPDPSQPLNCVTASFTQLAGTGQAGQSPTFVAGAAGTYVPGTAGSVVLAGASPTGSSGSGSPSFLQELGSVPGKLIQSLFDGFGLITRSPAEAAKFFGLLVLLGTPIVLAVRRRSWAKSVTGSAH